MRLRPVGSSEWLIIAVGTLALVVLASLFAVRPVRAALLEARVERLIYNAMPAEEYALSGGNYCDPYLQAAADPALLAQAWEQLNQTPPSPRAALARGRVACLAGDPASARHHYEEAARMDPGDPLARLELAFTAEAVGDIQTSLALWNGLGQEPWYFLEAAGLKPDEPPVRQSEAENMEHYKRALPWVRRANSLMPGNPDTLYRIGRLCQALGVDADEICQTAFHQRGDNLLLDPVGQTQPGWALSTAAGAAFTVQSECPGSAENSCAALTNVNQTDLAGLFQCARLEGGRDYRFSGWVRVDGPPEMTWNAVVAEGSPENLAPNTGPKDWSFWEIQLHPPAGSNEIACVSPVQLGPGGQAWFHSARLEILH